MEQKSLRKTAQKILLVGIFAILAIENAKYDLNRRKSSDLGIYKISGNSYLRTLPSPVSDLLGPLIRSDLG